MASVIIFNAYFIIFTEGKPRTFWNYINFSKPIGHYLLYDLPTLIKETGVFNMKRKKRIKNKMMITGSYVL